MTSAEVSRDPLEGRWAEIPPAHVVAVEVVRRDGVKRANLAVSNDLGAPPKTR